MISLSTRAKEAIKTGLAMVIAYGIALRMGWDDPFWPALTVVTVNMMTTGQSLPRGIVRTSGTLVGCVAALAILGLFPQERWWFMACLSLFIGFCTYMMKGKTDQYFWFLAALTCLLIPFKSMPLEPATAFQEAWLRTVETGTGALVWILVAAFLWPRSSVGAFNEANRKLWATQAQLYRTYRKVMSGSGTAEESRPLRLREVQLVARVGQLLDAAETDSYEVWGLRHQWRRFHHQSMALMEALERWRQGFAEIQPLNLTKLLPNLEAVYSELDQRFEQIGRMLAGEAPSRTAQPIALAVDKAEMRTLTRFEEAAVVVTRTQLENLERLSQSLFDCLADIRGDTRRAAEPLPDTTVRRGLAIDPDRFTAAITVMITLCVAFLLWVYINPPTGAGFAMMAAIFALIMQLAPAAKVSLQYLAWGSGAAFAGVLYVFVMPHLSSFTELAVLIFAANFAMYYILGEPRQTLARMLCMASFCILLTVDNQQSYSFSQYANLVAGLIMLPLTVAAATRYIPGSPRPEKAFLRLLRRFFRHAEFLISGLALDGEQKKGIAERWKTALYRNDLLEVPAKLAACGQQIDYRTFPANTPEQVQALVTSLYALANRIKDLADACGASQAELVKKQLLEDLRDWRQVIEGRFQLRAEQTTVGIESGAEVRDRLAVRLAGLEARIGETLAQAGKGELSTEDLKNFYRLLGSYRGLSEAAIGYGQLADGINWAQWREARL
jgi:uncharacterized membrane protein YccC